MSNAAGTDENAEQFLALAWQRQQAGDLAGAEQLYRHVLAGQPNHPQALHLLGCLALQVGQFDQAIAILSQAIASQPSAAELHASLGLAYQNASRFDDARGSYHRALLLNPQLTGVYCNLGNIAARLGRPDEAVACCLKAIELDPNLPEAYSNLGDALSDLGKYEDAVASYLRALQLKPELIVAYVNLGYALSKQEKYEQAILALQHALKIQPNNDEACAHLASALKDLKRLDEAAIWYQQALRLNPQSPEYCNNLGVALHQRGRTAEAAEAYQRAIQLKPQYAEAHNNLGVTLKEMGRSAEAVAYLQTSLRLKSDYVDAYNNLGLTWRGLNRMDEALAAHRKALALQPNSPEGHNNLGVVLNSMGRLAEAIASYRRAIEVRPGFAEAHSNLCLALNYDPAMDDASLLAEHRRYAEMQTRPAAPVDSEAGAAVTTARKPIADRPLRVGYVSPDFRRHSVARFLAPILSHHRADEVEAILYSEVLSPDDMTTRFQKLARGYRTTCGLTDEQVAETIKADGIDILVDLAGHTGHNRLPVFALKPAPVQVTYLGYPCSTGISQIDYCLTDHVCDPPDDPPKFVEQLWRLEGSFCCFEPLGEAPAVAPLPAAKNGYVTFGSLHGLAKLNDQVLDLWCRLLRAVPGSRLICFRDLLVGSAYDGLHRQLLAHGLPADRFELRHILPAGENHLSLYAGIDISLDAFPWSGHTTACESLWMGAPMVTLSGERHAARMVASVLTAIGLDSWIAHTPEEYIAIAARTAGNVNELRELRASLRDRMANSPLCDGAAFTRKLEHAYRQMIEAAL
jgi:protein O-GlcNAc transferase